MCGQKMCSTFGSHGALQARGGWEAHRVQKLSQEVAVLDDDDGGEGIRLVVDLH